MGFMVLLESTFSEKQCYAMCNYGHRNYLELKDKCSYCLNMVQQSSSSVVGLLVGPGLATPTKAHN
jgi:hypothetical protein